VLVNFPLQTAVAALHVFLGMGVPGSGTLEEKVLIWGAGGAVGSYAVQYAKSVSLGLRHLYDQNLAQMDQL
jgi:NADPH:quinone reductase-like Zn-dependent oxidoreductase